MISGVKIKSYKELTNHKKIAVYNKPKYLYVPLINGGDANVTILVKKGEYVYKGTALARTKGKYKIPMIAPVSGVVLGFMDKMYLNGNMVKTVVIENDFKETSLNKTKARKELGKIDRNEFLMILKNAGIVGLGGASFPTYGKYNTTKIIKTLIVNAAECEPYITADHVLLEEKCEEILEAIDAIMEINNIAEGYIAIKKTDTRLIRKLNNYIGTYVKIKIVKVPNIYPIGWEKNLVKYIKHTSYNNLPIEKGIVVNNVSTIYAIYEAIKYGRPLTERIVTFSGDMLKKPQNVLVKIGTSVKEVIEGLDGYKRFKDITFIAGGPMMGISLPNDDLVVTPNLTSVIVTKTMKELEEGMCLRCGKCAAVCPAKLAPVLIMDAKNNKEKLAKLEPNLCVECGLCSYICPAKIRVREYVKAAKAMMRGEK